MKQNGLEGAYAIASNSTAPDRPTETFTLVQAEMLGPGSESNTPLSAICFCCTTHVWHCSVFCVTAPRSSWTHSEECCRR